jgi:hypothetical protein
MGWRARIAAVALALSAFALAGCSASPQGGPVGPHFVTLPFSVVMRDPAVSLVGLSPGERIRLTAYIDAPGGRWESHATYTVPASGMIDFAATRPQLAPFATPDPTGLVWSLRGPELSPDASVRVWTESILRLHIVAVDGGEPVASTVVELTGLGRMVRPFAVFGYQLGGPGVHPTTTEEDYSIGRFYRPQFPLRPRAPAVLMFDDASPGASDAYVAPFFSLLGNAVFVIPAQADPDRVHLASTFSADRIRAIIGWLDHRPDVDPRHIFVYGSSQSEQLALWTASHFSSLVYGVFGAGGASALLCSHQDGLSMVLDGSMHAPCTPDSGRVEAAAVVSLAKVAGPVLLACTRSDEILPASCAWQAAAMQHRGARPDDVLIQFDRAAHTITVPPGFPLELSPASTAQATEGARTTFWSAVTRALEKTALQ